MVKHSTTVTDNVDICDAAKWNADHIGDLDLPLKSYTSKPTPGSGYLNKVIVVRSGGSAKSYIYVCVLNDANGYEWVQLGIST